MGGATTLLHTTLTPLLLVPFVVACVVVVVRRDRLARGLLTLLGITGLVYLVGALALGAVMLGLAVVAASDMNRARARRVFLFSLLYQPLLMGLLLFDTVRI